MVSGREATKKALLDGLSGAEKSRIRDFYVSVFITEFFCFCEVCLSFCIVAEFFIALAATLPDVIIIRDKLNIFIEVSKCLFMFI